MKYTFCLYLISFVFSSALNAQNSTDFFEKVDKIERHAKKGTGDADVKSLIKAIKLLIKSSDIRPLNYERKPLDEDYFNPHSLLVLADSFAYKKKHKRKLKRLRKKLKKIPNVRKQAPTPEKISIPGSDEFFFEDNEKREMNLIGEVDQHVKIRFKLGKEIKIRLFDSDSPRRPLFVDVGSKETKWIEFDAEKGKKYILELSNKTGEDQFFQLTIFAK